MSRTIVLNGRVLGRGRVTGVERLAEEIIGRLVQARPDLYRVFRPDDRVPRAGRHAWEQTALPVLAARAGAALIYTPSNVGPVAWPRHVLVLHDASVWRSPGSFSAAYGAWHRWAEGTAARRARRVITVSEFSRRELVDVLGLDPASVTVIPNGVGERFVADADPEPVRRRYRLDRPYVLTLASGQARKNVAVLESLARRLSAEGIDVVWAGTASSPAPDGVRALGYVDEGDLPGLYAGAEVFTFPSRYEGFGIPCIEAMACGTPVVAADRAALPETCGGAALLADPDDAEAFTAATLRLLDDRELRAELRAAGRRRAAELTWEHAAQRTDALLQELAGAAA